MQKGPLSAAVHQKQAVGALTLHTRRNFTEGCEFQTEWRKSFFYFRTEKLLLWKKNYCYNWSRGWFNLDIHRNHQVHNRKTGNLPNHETISQKAFQERQWCQFPGNQRAIAYQKQNRKNGKRVKKEASFVKRKKHVSSMRVPCPARTMPCVAVEYKRFPTNPLKQKNALFYVLLTKVRSPPVQKCYFTVYQCTIRFQAYQIRLFPDYTVIIFAPDKRKRYEKTLSPQQVTPLCATFSHEQ